MHPGGLIDSRCLVAQRRVRSLRMVLHPPGFNGRPCFPNRATPGLVQTFLPKPGVERLDTRMIRGRPRPAAGELDAMTMRPGIQGCGGALGTMIDQEGLRPFMCGGEPLQHRDHPVATQRGIDLDRWTLTRPVIDSREGPEPPPVDPAVADTIQTLGLMRGLRHRHRHPEVAQALLPALEAA